MLFSWFEAPIQIDEIKIIDLTISISINELLKLTQVKSYVESETQLSRNLIANTYCVD